MTHNEMPKDTVEELTVETTLALFEAIKKFQVSRDHSLDIDKVLKPFLTTAYNKGVEDGERQLKQRATRSFIMSMNDAEPGFDDPQSAYIESSFLHALTPLPDDKI
jgi:hypothetical protein